MNYQKIGLLAGAIVLLLLSILVPMLGFLMWFAFIPFLLAIRNWTPAKSFFAGLFIGTVFFAALLYWINLYESRIFAIVITLVAPFFGLFGWLTNQLWQKTKNELLQAFIPPIVWFAVAFIYLLTPLEIISDQIAFIQAPLFPAIVRLIGISGITFLILLVNSFIALWLATKRRIYLRGVLVAFFVLVFGVLIHPPPAKTKPIKVAIVQHNFPIPADWRMLHRKDITLVYEKAIRELGRTADLIVFPQYGLPVDALREPEWLNGLAKLTNTSILLGTYIPELRGSRIGGGKQFDTALLFSPDRPVQDYRAVTPPPFRHIGQIRGTKRNPLVLNDIKVGVMLCYEDVRPEEGKLWVKTGAELLVALSNPGHFLGTPLPRYHLLHDRIRAIETGRFVIRASPNGFSAIINPNGKILTQSRLNEETILKGVVYPETKATLFTQTGTVFAPVSALLSLILLVNNYGRASMKRLARKTR